MISDGSETSGINDQAIDALVIKLDERILNISASLEEMEKIISESSMCLKKDAADIANNAYALISQNHNIIKTNLENYKNNFITVKNNHIKYDESFRTNKVQESNVEGGDYTGVR